MEYKIASYNIKCDDTIADLKEEQLWENRKQNLLQAILKLNVDIIGMQEVMQHQYDYFNEVLKNVYQSTYCSRDRNAANGEGCPIFYKADKFELLEQKTFWLSETPDVPASSSWNSRWPRICSYVILKDKTSGNIFAFFNTHLDHKSEDARANGMKLIIKKIKDLNLPTILTGDFNSTQQNNAFIVANENLNNCNINNDNLITFHLWGHPEILQNGITNIDYVFQTGGFKTKSYKVMNDIKDAEKLSDHYAIVCELEL